MTLKTDPDPDPETDPETKQILTLILKRVQGDRSG